MKIQVGVIGSNDSESSDLIEKIAYELGKALVDSGFRILCGGMGGVMRAVARGAHSSPRYSEGDVIGILPDLNRKEMNEYVDIAITTGINYARNQIIVASSDVVVAIGGGAGTLSEMAYAWQLGKKIIAFDIYQGWSSKLSGLKIDNRREDRIIRVIDVEMAIIEIFSLIYKGKNPLRVGDIIEGYIVKELVSQHHNRFVYLVEKGGKKYILKLHDFVCEQDFKRFKKEIQTLVSLEHPHIQKVINSGSINEKIPYFISEYYGDTLRNASKKMTKEEKINVIAQIQDTINYLKQKGYVYRDLKAENIVVSEKDKRITLIDFYWCDKYHGATELDRMFEMEAMYNMGKIKYFLETGKRIYK